MTKHNLQLQQKQRLIGFLEGIAIDYELTDREVLKLAEELRRVEQAVSGSANSGPPYDLETLRTITASFLESGRLTEADKERLIQSIHAVLDAENRQDSYGTVSFFARLLGLLEGLLSDGVFTAQESVDLEDLLEDYAEHAKMWPFNEIRDVLESMTGAHVSAATSYARLLVVVSEVKAKVKTLTGSA